MLPPPRPLVLGWLLTRQAPKGRAVAVSRTDAEWRSLLSPAAHAVLVERGTERAFTSPLNAERRRGVFCCAGCGAALYDSADKFDSGTGWPSFVRAAPGGVRETLQPLYCLGDLGAREVRCASCEGHLGHVFSDGPVSRGGRRHCINGVALAFNPDLDDSDDAEAPEPGAEDSS